MSSSVIRPKQDASPSLARLHNEAGNRNGHLVAVAAQRLREREEVLRLTRAHTVGQGLRGLAQELVVGIGEGIKAGMKGPIDGFRKDKGRGVLQGAIDGVSEAGCAISVGVRNGCSKLAEGYTNHVTADKKLFGASCKNVRATRDDVVCGDILDVYRRERTSLYGGLDEVVLENEYEHSESANGDANGGCLEKKYTELYSIVGCQPNATSREVRKAFLAKSHTLHPDKNPDNPKAQEAFVLLCQAYETLSDPTRREEYDRTGSLVNKDLSSSDCSVGSTARSAPRKVEEPRVHPMAVFDAMFGNNKLIHIIGDMSTSMLFLAHADVGGIKSLSDDVMDSSFEAGIYRIERERFQAERRVWLTELLCRRLQPFVDGDPHAVLLHAHHEVVAIRDETFGTDLLRAVGSVYSTAARRAIPRAKSSLRSAIGHLEAKAEKVALRAALTEASASDDTAKLRDSDGCLQPFEQRYQSSLSRIWTIAKWDIQQTLKE